MQRTSGKRAARTLLGWLILCGWGITHHPALPTLGPSHRAFAQVQRAPTKARYTFPSIGPDTTLNDRKEFSRLLNIPPGGISDLTSDRLPAFPGQVWAAEVRSRETGARVVYIITHRPQQGWVGAFLFAPLTLQIRRLWQSECHPAGDGCALYVRGRALQFFVEYPWLIVNGQITRLRQMPKPGERPIAVPSFETQMTLLFPLSTGENDDIVIELCCAACCAVHCTLMIPCTLDELCCGRQCGPTCWCNPICCIIDSPRCF